MYVLVTQTFQYFHGIEVVSQSIANIKIILTYPTYLVFV